MYFIIITNRIDTHYEDDYFKLFDSNNEINFEDWHDPDAVYSLKSGKRIDASSQNHNEGFVLFLI
jgi:hypothetical protein